ncbi:MAG: hypothetical protein ABSH28_18895 [Acidobacteriota bacterium]
MKAAYIDTSLVIGIRFQKSPPATVRMVRRYELFSSELLIAEVLAFGKRESMAEDLLWDALKGLSWIIPDGSISEALRRVIHFGYARGANLWHLACACYLSPNPGELAFLTLDEQQRQLASHLGFHAPRLARS